MSKVLPNGRYTYTHFWATGPDAVPRASWQAFCKEAAILIQLHKQLIGRDNYDINMSGQVRQVYFMAEDASHFGDFRFSYDPASFCFCRTDYKPFDLLVKVILLTAKKHFKHWLRITSDGSWEEWQDAVEICRRHGNFSDLDEASAKADFDSLIPVS